MRKPPERPEDERGNEVIPDSQDQLSDGTKHLESPHVPIAEVELQRPPQKLPAIESSAKIEYFRFLRGQSEMQREIELELARKRTERGTFEDLLLAIIQSLLEMRKHGPKRSR